MKVEKNKLVTIEYEGKFEDGEVFDSSEKHGKPLDFVTGVGMVVPGFDNAVIGMEKGEEKEVTIEPKDGYGEYNEELKKDIPRNMLPPDQEPKKGMMLGMQTPDGRQIPAMIKEVTKDKIIIDVNHPLAGKKLLFKIKVLEIKDAPKAKSGDECGCKSHNKKDDDCKADECGDENCKCK
jgi:peptidylprolyl isomerase